MPAGRECERKGRRNAAMSVMSFKYSFLFFFFVVVVADVDVDVIVVVCCVSLPVTCSVLFNSCVLFFFFLNFHFFVVVAQLRFSRHTLHLFFFFSSFFFFCGFIRYFSLFLCVSHCSLKKD